ncbi:MAG: flavin reductase family protein [Bacilli bacterium]
MQKNIGAKLALYPMPVIVVGTMVEGKANWVLVGHCGIIGHDRVMVSLAKPHYTNKGIKETKTLSINIVDEKMLEKADYVGSVSGSKVDKSKTFEYHIGDAGAPIINEAPVVMECKVDDIYETDTFENFILKIENTYAQEENLNEKGKIDYTKFKPILFEFPNYTYLKTGETMGNCLNLKKGKDDKNEQ